MTDLNLIKDLDISEADLDREFAAAFGDHGAANVMEQAITPGALEFDPNRRADQGELPKVPTALIAHQEMEPNPEALAR